MRLDQYAESSSVLEENHSVLIYGPPKAGKTRLVGTAAKIKEVNNIYWFDTEKGISTLLRMGLSKEELAKVVLFSLPDTRDNPVACTTLLRALTSKMPVKICEKHGKIDCADCSKKMAPTQSFCLANCTHNDLVVIDSGSQLGDSALNLACLGTEVDYKATFDDFGKAGKYLGDMLSVIQQCHTTNFVVVTHELVDTDEINNVKRDRIYPLMGTRNFCRKVAKYFGTVAYVHLKAGKHSGGSGSTYKLDTLTGSRINALLEKDPQLTMASILVTAGVLKSATVDGKTVEQTAVEAKPAAKPVTNNLAALMAAKNKK